MAMIFGMLLDHAQLEMPQPNKVQHLKLNPEKQIWGPGLVVNLGPVVTQPHAHPKTTKSIYLGSCQYTSDAIDKLTITYITFFIVPIWSHCSWAGTNLNVDR